MNNEDLAKQLLNEFDNQSIENPTYNDERDENNDESSQNDELNSNGPKTLNFEWIEGLRTGSRLVWVPSEESIYYANAISKKKQCNCMHLLRKKLQRTHFYFGRWHCNQRIERI